MSGLLPVAILAGGRATRLHPLTETLPKSLIDVCGEPFIAHQLRLLRSQGASRVVLCTGFGAEQIQAALGDGRQFGLQVDYSFDGPQLLGTAGALRQARHLLGEAFLVLYGDSYLLCDFAAVQAAFVDSGALGLMTVFRNDGRWDRSNVEFAGGKILAHDKRQPTARMQHIDYGLGALRAAALERVGSGVRGPGSGVRPYDLSALYQDLLATGDLAGFEVAERFYEIGSFEGLEELRGFLGKSH